ncbi:alkane 1-monooxygenase [Mycobacterium sp.]|uniref:alkane 1-monooxygenase n=1 Tax=Mycobacterium sp. TaxID=1785 RepID=UPI003F9CE9DF
MASNVDADSSPGSTAAGQWRDKKRYLYLIGLTGPTALFSVLPVICAMNQLGWQTASQALFWMNPVLLYVVLPLLDLRYGPDGQNPPDEVMGWLAEKRYYRYCIYAYIPCQYASVVFGAYLFTTDNVSWLGFAGSLSCASKIGVALSVGVLGGVGMNVAHELGHKKYALERWLSKITLAQTCYGHFFVAHNRGHHVRVATPEDPASARMGESLWAFLPRSIWGSLRSSWHLEAERMRRLNERVFIIRNNVLNAWLMSVVLWGLLLAIFGRGLIPFILIQAVFGFVLLESVNYLTHYGLLRQKTPRRRYERCTLEHSWNSEYLVSNIVVYQLQRHSDHHVNPARRYQVLRSFDGAPNLPSGFASMICLAYFPPLWRRVMDRRVLAHYGGDVTKANLHPAKREKLLAQYGRAAA